MSSAVKQFVSVLMATVLCATVSTCQPNKRTVKVVLYPFVPEYDTIKKNVKTEFERAHPEIELQFIDLTDNYYAPGSAADKYIGATKADVYELDSVFLVDFATTLKKIRHWPEGTLPPESEFLRNAALGSRVGDTRYGMPHWVCGNFLFFRAGDPAFANIYRLSELEKAIGTPSHEAGKGLATDLKGKSTLGEFYLEAASDHYGNWPAAQSHLSLIEPNLSSDLARLFGLCDSGNCRNDAYHKNDPGIYARMFDDGKARAFVGYSELMHTALVESTHCSVDKCLTDNDLDVIGFPSDDNGRHQISWVDSFVLDVDCTAQCAEDAAQFAKFMVSENTYKELLLHSTAVPEYLLPARASLYNDPEIIRAARLYPKLKTIIEGAAVPSAAGLNDTLRQRGVDLDKQLPQ